MSPSAGRLPGRENIVITRQKDYRAAGCTVFHGIETALEACANHAEVMVMGGASLYEELLPRAARIYLTRVEAEVDGDTWFPAVRHRRLERGRTPGLPGRRAQRTSLTVSLYWKETKRMPTNQLTDYERVAQYSRLCFYKIDNYADLYSNSFISGSNSGAEKSNSKRNN